MKKTVNFLIAAVLFGFLANPSFAQHAGLNDGVLPPSSAGALGKYTDIPVSLYTGTPQINIPLTSVHEGPLTLPVSLSYHASGIRVDELASNVGIGWYLNCGGAITRTVMGFPDDEQAKKGYYDHGVDWQGQSPINQNILNEIEDGDRDGEPDIFSFNFAGYTGKFFFDHNQQVHFIPKSDLKIEVTRQGPSFLYFDITDLNGTKYRFATREVINDLSESLFYHSNWHLSEIETHDGKHKIQIQYVENNYIYKSLASCTTIDGNTNCEGNDYQGSDPRKYHSFSIYGNIIKSITTSTESLEFSYESRQDVEPFTVNSAKAINQIKYTSGAYAYKYILDYGYFQDPNDHSGSPEAKRLKLNSIQKVSNDDSIDENPYVFTYNGTFLPNRLSKARDHWGYYNGVTSNNQHEDFVSSLENFGNCDRESRNESIQSKGILTKIKYPTGGSTTFIYQANRANRLNNQFKNNIVDIYSCLEFGSQCCGYNEEDSRSYLTEEQIANGRLEVHGIIPVQSCPSNIRSVSFQIRNTGNGTIVANQSFQVRNSVEKIKVDLKDLNLDTGIEYEFKVTSSNCSGLLKVFYYRDNQFAAELVGGLRIHSTITSDGLSSTRNIIKTYEYLNHRGKSSGLLFDVPRYRWWCGSVNKTLYLSSPTLALSNFEGYHIGYSRVTEKHNGHGHKIVDFNIEDPYPISHDDVDYSDHPLRPDLPRIFSGVPKTEETFREGASSPYMSTEIDRNSNDTYQQIGGYHAAIRRTCGQTIRYTPRTSIYRPASIRSTTDGVTSSKTLSYGGSNLLPKQTIEQFDANTSIRTKITYTDNHFRPIYKTEFVKRNIITPYNTEIYLTSPKYPSEVRIGGTEKLYRFFNPAGEPTQTASGNHPYVHALRPYEMTWDANGNAIFGQRYVIHFNKYDMTNGYVKEKQRDNWPAETYTYDSKNRLITKNYENFTTSYVYDGNSDLIQSTTAPNGLTSTYTYDKLMRLKTKTDNCSNVVTEYDYHFHTSSLSTDKNYTSTKTTYPSVTGSNLGIIENIDYLDGLGRSIQSVAKRQGPNLNDDVILQTEYNKWGQIHRQFEAVKATGNNGAYYAGITSSNTPHAISEYYNEPSGRLSRTKSAGWTQYTEYSYGTNNTADAVLDKPAGTAYAEGELIKRTVIDGNDNKTITFTDKRGRLILKRMTNSTESLKNDTYYNYDGKNRLTTVYPPVSTASTPKLLYTYQYDVRDHVIEKKVPGKAAMYYRYTKRDQVGYSQDAYLRAQNRWYAYTYDNHGRELKSGYRNSSTVSANLDFTAAIINTDLSENIYGTTGIEIDKIKTSRTKILDGGSNWLSSTFTYDGCGRVSSTSGNNHLNLTAGSEVNATTYDWGDNALTSTRTHQAHGHTQTIRHTMTYDHAGRLDQSKFKLNNHTEHILSDKTYDHKNQVIQCQIGKMGANNFLQTVNYGYLPNGLLEGINLAFSSSDLFHERIRYTTGASGVTEVIQHNGNISAVESQVRGQSKRTYGFTYDYLDRLTVADYYGGSSATSNDFNVNVSYDARSNISSLTRRAKISGVSAEQIIDNLSYTHIANSNQIQKVTDAASASYRAHGYNPKTNSNYTYDANGNVTYDPSRDVSFTYNHLDLPVQANFGNNKIIDWVYDANGGLLTKRVKQNGITMDKRDYLSGIEYRNDVIDVIYHSEGRVVNTNNQFGAALTLSGPIGNKDYQATSITSTQMINAGAEVDYLAGGFIQLNPGFSSSANVVLNAQVTQISNSNINWRYDYHLLDHLGNTRVLFSDLDGNGNISPSTELLNSYNYYPFGMQQTVASQDVSDNDRYQYNGIEYIEDFGLDYNMATYRMLDPCLGKWMQVDPKTESLMGLSPYNSMNNNPVSFSDPEGDFIIPALVGAAIGVIGNGIGNTQAGQGFFEGGLKAGILGAIGGAASFGLGNITGAMSTLGSNLTAYGVQNSWSTISTLTNIGGHALLGGGLSSLGGGSFASGALSGGFAAGSSIALSGLGIAGQIAGGGLSGGLGSVLGGGSFTDGVTQGLITSGLNHAAHAGLFGEGLAASLITGKTRHIFGPDAKGVSVDGNVYTLIGGVGGSGERVSILRGPDEGTSFYTVDGAIGAGIDVSAGVSYSKYYYSGRASNFYANQFQGGFFKFNAAITAGIDIGGSFSVAPVNKFRNAIYGFTATSGVGIPNPFGPWSASIELGFTKKSK